MDGQLALAGGDARIFGLWILKTWLGLAHPGGHVPVGALCGERWDLAVTASDLYGWMVDSLTPPGGLSVRLARQGKTVPGDEPRRIPLPTVVDGGKAVKFQALRHGFDFGNAGFFDVSLVYHPGWEIDHPHESEGRAVRLWPQADASTVDLGALQPIGHDDVHWLRGPTIHCEPGAFANIAAVPLSPTTTFLPPQPGIALMAW